MTREAASLLIVLRDGPPRLTMARGGRWKRAAGGIHVGLDDCWSSRPKEACNCAPTCADNARWPVWLGGKREAAVRLTNDPPAKLHGQGFGADFRSLAFGRQKSSREAPPFIGPPNGLEVHLRGQGLRGYGSAARRLPACEARGAGGVTPLRYR